MQTGDLFCLKTNSGYGLFQAFGQALYSSLFYVIYVNQVETITEDNILKVLKGKYYYERINFGDVALFKFNINAVISNKNVEFTNSDFGISENNPCFGKFNITYLGNYDLPDNIKQIKFSRNANFSYFTGKYKWYVFDEINSKLVEKENGKPISYKKLTPEIAGYPRMFAIWLGTLLEHFNTGYTTEDYNDAWVENILEEFYIENPNMRPTDIKYEDVKTPLPTDSLRQAVGSEDGEYNVFCNKVDEALLKFISCIDENRKAVQKPLVKLISELNKISKETESFGSMEAEEIYEYIVNILRALKKNRLIETLETMRDW